MYDDQNANVALLSFSCSTNVSYLQEIGFCQQGWHLGDYKYFLVRGVGDEDLQIGSGGEQICEIHPPKKGLAPPLFTIKFICGHNPDSIWKVIIQLSSLE